MVRLLLAGVVSAVGFAGCSDECSSPRDCPSNQTCVAGQCVSTSADIVVPPRPDIPDAASAPDAGDAEAGADADASGGNGGNGGGDAGAPDADAGAPAEADVVGTVHVRQFARTQSITFSEAGGAVVDLQNADVDVLESTVPGGVATCLLQETTVNTAPVGVPVETVEFTLEQTPVTSYVLEGSFTGALTPSTPLPDRIFEGATLQRVTFDVNSGLGTGRPENIPEVAVPGPPPFAPLTPSPALPLSVLGGATFTFTPLPLPGDRLALRMYDETRAVLLSCEASALAAGSYTLPPAAASAFFDAGPTGEVTLDIGYVTRASEETGVQGGGDARFDFEVYRGSRYAVIVP